MNKSSQPSLKEQKQKQNNLNKSFKWKKKKETRNSELTNPRNKIRSKAGRRNRRYDSPYRISPRTPPWCRVCAACSRPWSTGRSTRTASPRCRRRRRQSPWSLSQAGTIALGWTKALSCWEPCYFTFSLLCFWGACVRVFMCEAIYLSEGERYREDL